jgi:hypothetical protein
MYATDLANKAQVHEHHCLEKMEKFCDRAICGVKPEHSRLKPYGIP